MNFLTRTIIMLVVFNLATGSFALAQAEGQAEDAAEPTTRKRGRRSPMHEALVPLESSMGTSTFTISGRTGLGGVIMLGLPGNVVTDPSGYYTATVKHSFTGRVVPVKEGFNFEPTSISYRKITNNRDNQNYVAKMMAFTISGTTGIGGVEMQGLPGNPVTASDGTYKATVPYGFSGRVVPVKEGFTFSPPIRHYTSVTSDQTNRNYISQRIGPAPILRRTGGRKVLVIPDSDVKPAVALAAITHDLVVMSHILDERFKGSRTMKGVFTDFGDFFGRDNSSTEAIYIQGYGVVFLMEVNFAFSPPLISEEQKDEETAEQVDPTWQRAREQIFSPRTPRPDMPDLSGQGPGLVEFDQLKRELIETLKHAANIRNLSPDEWIIVTVIGQGRQSGELHEYYYRSTAPSSGTSTSRRSRRPSSRPSSSGGGGFGGGMGGFGGGYSVSGRTSGGMSGGMMGGMGMSGGMGGYGVMGPPSATVMTIRAKKSDVDDFARDELDFEQFQETVEIFTY